MNRKRVIVLVVLSMVIGAGLATAAGTVFSETRYVSYGEVETKQSSVDIVGYDEVGPGINTEEVVVQTENTDNELVNGTVEVWLMANGEEEVRYSETDVKWESGEEKDVTLSVDRVREHEYERVDIRVQEN